jgi:hypothetical protein
MTAGAIRVEIRPDPVVEGRGHIVVRRVRAVTKAVDVAVDHTDFAEGVQLVGRRARGFIQEARAEQFSQIIIDFIGRPTV